MPSRSAASSRRSARPHPRCRQTAHQAKQLRIKLRVDQQSLMCSWKIFPPLMRDRELHLGNDLQYRPQQKLRADPLSLFGNDCSATCHTKSIPHRGGRAGQDRLAVDLHRRRRQFFSPSCKYLRNFCNAAEVRSSPTPGKATIGMTVGERTGSTRSASSLRRRP